MQFVQLDWELRFIFFRLKNFSFFQSPDVIWSNCIYHALFLCGVKNNYQRRTSCNFHSSCHKSEYLFETFVYHFWSISSNLFYVVVKRFLAISIKESSLTNWTTEKFCKQNAISFYCRLDVGQFWHTFNPSKTMLEMDLMHKNQKRKNL